MAYEKCIRFDLKRPCKDCPFLHETSVIMSPERRKEIADSLLAVGAPFPCHKTLDYTESERPPLDENSQFCAGALLSLAKDCLLMAALYPRLAAIMGNFVPDDLVWDAISDVIGIGEFSGKRVNHVLRSLSSENP